MVAAQKFINEHKDDIALNNLLARARDRNIMHSDRWSMIYDYMAKNYPEVTGFIITGLTYNCEA